MSNIFMSYSREDRPTAERLAAAFTAHDFTVWWDRNIPTGGTFDTIIEQELNSADCVVVLWSKTSVESNWVKEEAGRGLERNALVPVLIDQVQIPLGFGRIEGAELWDWKGDKKHPEFVQLIQSLRAKTGRTDSHPTLRPVPAPPPIRPDTPRPSRIHRYALIALVVLVALGGIGAWQFENLPVPLKAIISGHIKTAQTELANARSMLDAPSVANEDRLRSFQLINTSHGDHLARDFSTGDQFFIQTTSDALGKAVAIEELDSARNRLDDPTIPNREILEEFRHVSAEHEAFFGAAEIRYIDSVIGLLDPAVRRFDELMAAEDTVPITESVSLWRAYLALPRPRASAPADSVVRARIDAIESIIAERATIATAANAKMCRRVSNLNCSGEAAVFNRGEVNFWARVRVPRTRETLTLQWVGPSGSVDETHPFAVERSQGFRVYRERNFPEAGTYEARLYNSRNELIARKVFEVQ